MESEFSVLRDAGLPDAPDETSPASNDARTAKKHYDGVVAEFARAFLLVKGLLGKAASPDLAKEFFSRIDYAIRMAGEVRLAALALRKFPRTFYRVDNKAVYYSAIADAAERAYESRLSTIDEVEHLFGREYNEYAPPYRGVLHPHEGFKGGHLMLKHIAWTMEQFKTRFMEEEQKKWANKKHRVLSSFLTLEIAEEVVWTALVKHEGKIARFPEGEPLWLDFFENRPVGYVKVRGEPPRLSQKGSILIFVDSSHPLGFRITTAILK